MEILIRAFISFQALKESPEYIESKDNGRPGAKSLVFRWEKETIKQEKVLHGILNLTFRMLQYTSSEVTITTYDKI